MGQQRPWDNSDVIMACAGDIPTLETLAAVDILRKQIPDLKIRVINVVNLMKLQPPQSILMDFLTKISTSYLLRINLSFSLTMAIPG